MSEDVPELDLLVFNIYLKIIYLNKVSSGASCLHFTRVILLGMTSVSA